MWSELGTESMTYVDDWYHAQIKCTIYNVRTVRLPLMSFPLPVRRPNVIWTHCNALGPHLHSLKAANNTDATLLRTIAQ